MGNSSKVHWRHLVWNRLSIPKAKFICWLAAHQGLKTKDTLKRNGVVDDDLCPLCSLYSETRNHLFFECPFSLLCVARVKAWTRVGFKSFDRMDVRKSGLSQVKQRVLIMVYASIIYHIWECRNEAIWKRFIRSPRCIVELIKTEVSQRCHAVTVAAPSAHTCLFR